MLTGPSQTKTKFINYEKAINPRGLGEILSIFLSITKKSSLCSYITNIYANYFKGFKIKIIKYVKKRFTVNTSGCDNFLQFIFKKKKRRERADIFPQ